MKDFFYFASFLNFALCVRSRQIILSIVENGRTPWNIHRLKNLSNFSLSRSIPLLSIQAVQLKMINNAENNQSPRKTPIPRCNNIIKANPYLRVALGHTKKGYDSSMARTEIPRMNGINLAFAMNETLKVENWG